MKTAEKILSLLAEHPRSASEMAGLLDISRQAVSSQLRAMIARGAVAKEGDRKGATFRLAGRRSAGAGAAGVRFEKVLALKGLEEDLVLTEVSLRLGLRERLSPQAFAVFRYAFTELLNNAIDHSQSAECRLSVAVGAHDIELEIRDFGIGAFESIRSRFGLRDEDAAVAELLKGKATTMAERHSGEGLFFTSKAADRFVLRSHRTALKVERGGEVVSVEAGRFLKGTDARFAVSARSRRRLDEVFREYAPEEFDFRFEKTRVLVRLGLDQCVSRSEARRMLSRLENFREVTLDFGGVAELGQAFADEVFRVFLRSNPGTAIRVENLKPELRPMVGHVTDLRTAERVTLAE